MFIHMCVRGFVYVCMMGAYVAGRFCCVRSSVCLPLNQFLFSDEIIKAQ